MSIIPVGYSQVTAVFGGACAPTGAVITCGHLSAGYATPELVALTIYPHYALLLDGLSQSLKLDRVEVKFGPNATGPTSEFTGESVGNVSGPADPPNTAILVQKLTGEGGRQNRGRWYIPGIPSDDAGTGGLISSVLRTKMEGNCADFLAAVISDGLTPVVLHGPGVAGPPTPVIELNVSGLAATQRRRMRR